MRITSLTVAALFVFCATIVAATEQSTPSRDQNTGEVRSLSSDGTSGYTSVRTVAGGSKKLLNEPAGLALLPGGDLLVADSKNDRIARVSMAGVVSHFAGGSRDFKRPEAVALHQQSGMTFVADTGNSRIRRIAPDGSISTFASESLKRPRGLAVTAEGTVYVADSGNDRIVRITSDGVMTVVAGHANGPENHKLVNGPVSDARFKDPGAIVLSGSGTIYVADSGNHAIRKIENDFVSTIAGDGHPGFADGTADLARFKKPSGIALDSGARLIVADSGNQRIRSISLAEPVTVSTIAGNGKSGFVDGAPLSAEFKEPDSIVIAGAIFIADRKNHAIRAIDLSLAITAVSPTEGPLAAGTVIRLTGVGFTSETAVKIGDREAIAVTVISDSALDVTLPSGTPGTFPITVTTADGSATLQSAYTYVVEPLIQSVTPSHGPAGGGTIVTITGSRFTPSAKVAIGGVLATTSFVSETLLRATTPPGAAGVAAVQVTTAGGSASLANSFTYLNPPVVTAVEPWSGTVGASVRIAGSGLAPLISVTIGGIDAPMTAASSNEIIISVPPGAVSAPITITTAGGSFTSAQPFMVLVATSLVVSPDTAEIDQDGSQQFSSIVKYSDASTRSVAAVWSTTDPAVASIDGGGLARGLAPGITTIAGRYDGLSGSATLKVKPRLESITIEPATATIDEGSTQRFTAFGVYSDGSSRTIAAQWESSDATIAAIDSDGIASAIRSGTTSIKATYEGKFGSATLVVQPRVTSIEIIPPSASIDHRETLQFAARVVYSDGTTETISPAWVSSNPTVLRIDVSGIATGVSPGEVVVSASFEGKSATAAVVVRAVLESIEIEPVAATIEPGGTRQFAATGNYSDGARKPVMPEWTSSDPAVATISSDGLAHGIASGATTITAFDHGKQATATLTVALKLISISIAPPSASMIVGSTQRFTATGSYSDGSSSEIHPQWTSSNPAVLSIDAFGDATANQAGSATITASAAGVEDAINVAVVQNEPLPPDPASIAPPIDPTKITTVHESTRFLYEGTPRIQTGVAEGTIKRLTAAVIRGRVLDVNGSPLPGVRVTVYGHSEYGQTLARADGWYDLAVNGGVALTVRFEKRDLISADRYVNVPVNDFLVLEDLALVAYDPLVTEVPFGSSRTTAAMGSVITDERGSRRAVMIFSPGTSAKLELPEGGSRDVSTLSIRATEFTVGEAGPMSMPAELPAATRYTYCVELSADEAVEANATRVTFDRPVAFYLENFLDFPAGGIVPAGYYERSCGTWVPSENGRIVTIVAITEGRAYLDATGDELADDTDALIGTTIAEREKLATIYRIGQQLWRVPITHLTPWDLNWPGNPPADAIGPPSTGAAVVPTNACPRGDSSATGSIIGCESQSLGELIGLTGTRLTAAYNSTRTRGNEAAQTIEILLSDDFIPSSMRSIRAFVSIAGKPYRYDLTPSPRLKKTLIWDGRDAYGRTVQGRAPVGLKIHYIYPTQYAEPADRGRSFGAYSQYPGIVIGEADSPSEMGLTRVWYGTEAQGVGQWDSRGAGFGGWTLDIHHIYDTSSNTLYTGDGKRHRAEPGSATIRSVFPSASPSAKQHRSQLAEGSTEPVRDVVASADGTLFIAYNNAIYRTTAEGESVLFAGDGSGIFNGEGVEARSAGIAPTDLELASDGSLYFADELNRRVRVIRGGVVTTVAGNGNPGAGADGSAVSTPLTPRTITLSKDGMYIVDRENRTVYLQNFCDGRVAVLSGSAIDEVPRAMSFRKAASAVEVASAGLKYDSVTNLHLYEPEYTAVSPSGELYFSANRGRLFKASEDGFLYMLVGPGATCESYAECRDNEAAGVGFVGQTLYYASPTGNTVWSVTDDSELKRFAGTGIRGTEGDGGFAQAAQMDTPRSLQARNGRLYVGEKGRVRIIEQPYSGLSLDEITVGSPDGTEIYIFEKGGRHLRTIDALLGLTIYTFTYDQQGYLTSITDRYDNVTRIERSGANPTAIVAPGGQRTTLTANGDGFLSSIGNPAEEAHVFAYRNGLLTSMKTPRGHEYGFIYDEGGRLTEDHDPAGGVTTLVRSGEAASFIVRKTTAEQTSESFATLRRDDTEIRVHIDTAGFETTTAYDAAGGLRITSPLGTLFRTKTGDQRFGLQSPVNQASEVVTERGIETARHSETFQLAADQTVLGAEFTTSVGSFVARTIYSASSRTMTHQLPSGRTAVDIYDAKGRIVRRETPGVLPVIYEYDSRGRLTAIRQGTRETRFDYDNANRLTVVHAPMAMTSRFEHDAADRVVRQLLPGGRTLTASYDANGNLTALQPPGRTEHRFTYTEVDLASNYNLPLAEGTGAMTAAYDRDRRLRLLTRPDGAATMLSYDSAGRPEALTIGRGSYEYSYDQRTGELAMAYSPDDILLSYSRSGGLVTAVQWQGVVEATLARGWNDLRQITDETIACRGYWFDSCRSIYYRYDEDGLLASAGDLTLLRDPSNGILEGTTLGATETMYAYNSYGEAIEFGATIGGVPFARIEYVRDDLGRITRATEGLNGETAVVDYGYDAAGRLSRVTRNGTAVTEYGYDENGNRLSKRSSGATVSAFYDAQDRLVRYGDATYEYTAAGELKAKRDPSGATAYTYDEIGNLVKVVKSDGTTIEYLVDAENRRVAKKVNGEIVQRLVWRSGLQIAAEVDASGSPKTRYVYATRSNVPDYMIRENTLYRIVADHLGSPRLVMRVSDGDIAQRIDYDEFGYVARDTNPGFQPFGFAGGLDDVDTKLVRFGARDYDPQTGRWTAKDPIAFKGGVPNLYEYGASDPLNFRDENGRQVIGTTGGVNGSAGPGVAVSEGIVGSREGLSTVVSYTKKYGLGVGAEIQIIVLPFEKSAKALEKTTMQPSLGCDIGKKLGFSFGPVMQGTEAKGFFLSLGRDFGIDLPVSASVEEGGKTMVTTSREVVDEFSRMLAMWESSARRIYTGR